MILNIKALFEFFAKPNRSTLVNLLEGLETIFLNMRRRRRNAWFVVLITVFAFGLPFEAHEIKEMVPFCYVHSVIPCLGMYNFSTKEAFSSLLESHWQRQNVLFQ